MHPFPRSLPSPRPARGNASPRLDGGRQRGSMAITIMLMMIGLVAILGLVEVGYLYWAKRDAQKVADLAALAGAQRLDLCTTDNADNAAARQSAEQDNGFGTADGKTVAVTCGHWNPVVYAGIEDHFGNINETDGLNLNAVKVIARRPALPIFGQAFAKGDLVVSASAVAAQAEPQVAFSVGSRLLGINGDAPLQLLLQLIGLDLSATEVASYSGLANLKITPSGLLEALHLPVGTDITVGDYENLLAANSITVTELLDVMATLADQQGLVGINLSILKNYLNNVSAGTGGPLGQVKINLLDQDDSPGLFASISAPGSEAAAGLDVNLNALDLLGAAITIANGDHAVDIPNVSLLGDGVKIKASIIEPASIGVGPVKTTAYNAQVRLNIDIDTDGIPVLGWLLNWLGTRVHVPLYVDVVNAAATVSGIDCAAAVPSASFTVRSSIAGICLGKTERPWDSTSLPVDTQEMCKDETLIRLFGSDLLPTSIILPAISDTQPAWYAPGNIWIPEGETGFTDPNSLPIGNTVDALVDALLGVLGDLLNPAGDGNNSSDTAKALAKQYLDATIRDSGWYDPDAVVKMLKNGDSDHPAVGSWETDKVPEWCAEHLGLFPCLVNGDVWTGFNNVVTGNGGLLSGLTGLLGLSACNGLLTAITPLTYNNCVKNALAYYLQTKPGGLEAPSDIDYTTEEGINSCNSVICLVLKPLALALRPILNKIGNGLSWILSEILGLELGVTDVHVQSIQCHPARLVY